MNKERKFIVVICIVVLIIILAISVFNLVVYLSKRIGVNTVTFVDVSDDNEVNAAVPDNIEVGFSLDDVVTKDLNLKNIDINDINLGDYIFLYVKDAEGGVNCDNTNYYCKVNRIENNSINVEIPNFDFYSFDLENVKIKDINGKKISASDLKFGDNLKVINVWPDNIPSIGRFYEGYPSSEIYDVKSIRIVEPDQETIKNLENRNMMAIKEAVIAGVNEDSLYVVDSENKDLLYEVSFAKEGNIGFKQGQKIKIYFNGNETGSNINGVLAIQNVGKIEIADDENEQLISNDILKKFYTSFDNVDISIDNLTNTGLTMTVTDNNNLKYEFANKFTLSRNIAKKPDNSVIKYDDGSIAIPGYEGDKWQELSKISDNVANTGTAEIINENTTRWTFDWSNIYGPIGSGEYRFVLGDADNNQNYFYSNNEEIIYAKFTVEDNGQINIDYIR